MTCERVGAWIVCGDFAEESAPPCVGCGAASTRECDGPAPGGSGRKTCDAAICDGCAVQPGVLVMPSDAIDRFVVQTRARSRWGWSHSPLLAEVKAEPMDLCPACAPRRPRDGRGTP